MLLLLLLTVYLQLCMQLVCVLLQQQGRRQ
jgi:hypothetical protein